MVSLGRFQRAARLAFASALVAAALAGGCHQTTRPTPAGLKVVAEPADARVYVDDRFVASARVLARKPHELKPGVHRVSITAPGYFPHDLELELPSGVSTIEIRLRPVPP